MGKINISNFIKGDAKILASSLDNMKVEVNLHHSSKLPTSIMLKNPSNNNMNGFGEVIKLPRLQYPVKMLQDTYVDEKLPLINFATSQTLLTGDKQQTYMQFDLSNVPREVSDYILDAYVIIPKKYNYNSKDTKISIYDVNKNWLDTNITFKNRPLKTSLISTGEECRNVYKFSIGDYIKDVLHQKRYDRGFVIESPKQLQFNSAEASVKPELTIVYYDKNMTMNKSSMPIDINILKTNSIKTTINLEMPKNEIPTSLLLTKDRVQTFVPLIFNDKLPTELYVSRENCSFKEINFLLSRPWLPTVVKLGVTDKMITEINLRKNNESILPLEIKLKPNRVIKMPTKFDLNYQDILQTEINLNQIAHNSIGTELVLSRNSIPVTLGLRMIDIDNMETVVDLIGVNENKLPMELNLLLKETDKESKMPLNMELRFEGKEKLPMELNLYKSSTIPTEIKLLKHTESKLKTEVNMLLPEYVIIPIELSLCNVNELPMELNLRKPATSKLKTDFALKIKDNDNVETSVALKVTDIDNVETWVSLSRQEKSIMPINMGLMIKDNDNVETGIILSKQNTNKIKTMICLSREDSSKLQTTIEIKKYENDKLQTLFVLDKTSKNNLPIVMKLDKIGTSNKPTRLILEKHENNIIQTNIGIKKISKSAMPITIKINKHVLNQIKTIIAIKKHGEDVMPTMLTIVKRNNRFYSYAYIIDLD